MNMNPELAVARRNMVENQVRPWEVLDARVLDVLATLPREAFVPKAYQSIAYADVTLPIGHDEVMLKPVVEGRILQALLPAPGERVLEIGTGTGYFAACLARLCAQVTSIDHRADFVAAARSKLKDQAIGNVDCVHANALDGYAPQGTFDAIAVTGAVATLPPAFAEWLKPTGRMFVIRGTSPAMQAVLLQRAADGGWIEDRLFETDAPYLAGAAPSRTFNL
ncbi:MAG: protein-L-isoaspartate O-methyltransferase [Xanthomonadaceae bacterium]|nr:protein-L-isoaspartate O-methyltransferase [Xanthomonadaceae bacterium]